ncbi:MAG: tetratricopeptide repeat protein [Pirellulales bacterium]
MRRVRELLNAVISAIPRPVLYPLVVVAIAYTAYTLIQNGRFEYAYYRAGLALDREAFDEAGDYLAECLRLSPDSGRARFRAAQAARRSDQPEFAEEQLAYCDELAWPVEAVEMERRMLEFQRGEGSPGCEQLIRMCLSPLNPDRELAFEALSKGYARTYQLYQALETLNAWLEVRPKSLGARMRRAWVLERLDRHADAAADYRSVLADFPADSQAKLRLAQVLRQQGKTVEAAELFQELKAEAPPSDAIDLGLAQSYRVSGRGDEAKKLLDELSSRTPNDHVVWLELGKLDLDEGRDQEAREKLEKAVRLAAEEYEPNYQLFLCLQRLGDKEGAAKAEKKFKAIEADLKKMGELTEALQTKPHDPEIRFQIAQIFIRRGEIAEGTNWLEAVVRLDPTHRESRRQLAEFYEQLGKPDRARLHRQAIPPTPGS